jgi:hypothetical protein
VANKTGADLMSERGGCIYEQSDYFGRSRSSYVRRMIDMFILIPTKVTLRMTVLREVSL